MAAQTLAQLQTVYLDPHTDTLVILDQTQLPLRTVYLSLTKQNDIRQAIYRLQVRGAPAIGVAAAIGIYLAAKDIQADTYDAFCQQFRAAKDHLASARPTAVNLQWALERMERVVQLHAACPPSSIIPALKQEALRIQQEDTDVCRAIGEHAYKIWGIQLNEKDFRKSALPKGAVIHKINTLLPFLLRTVDRHRLRAQNDKGREERRRNQGKMERRRREIQGTAQALSLIHI